jgi:hypothetical protein
VPAVTDSAAYVPLGIQTFGEPPVEIGPLYVPTHDYQVVDLAQQERIRPRDEKVIPTVEVSFRVPGLPGVFTIRIDNYAFRHVDVLEYLRERSHLIRSLYALPAKLPPYQQTSEADAAVLADLQAAAEAAASGSVTPPPA